MKKYHFVIHLVAEKPFDDDYYRIFGTKEEAKTFCKILLCKTSYYVYCALYKLDQFVVPEEDFENEN